MKKYYAVVRWMLGDVQGRKPGWSKKRCEKLNERKIQDRLIELGNDVIDDLLVGEKEVGRCL